MVLNMDYSPGSNANRTYRDRVAYLEAEIAAMRKTFASLSSPLFNPKITLGEDSHFSPMERRVLSVLHTYMGKFVNHEPLIDVLYGCDPNPPQDDVIKVYVSKIRKKLTHHDIVCDWGVGYSLIKKG